MARIPQYEQAQLASSVVGTPGVDTSATQMFNTISGAAGEVAQQAQYALTAQRQLEYQAAREARAAAKAQQKALDEVQVATETAKLMPTILARQDEIKNSTPPEQWATTFNNDLPTVLGQIENGQYSPEVKAGLQKNLAGIFKTETDQIHSAALTQRTKNAETETANSYDALVERAGQETTVAGVGKLWAEADKLAAKASLVFGDAKAAELTKKAKEGMAKEYLYAATVKSPEAVQQIIDSKAFESVLSEKDKEDFIFKAHSLVRAKEAQAKADTRDAVAVSRIESDITSLKVDRNDPQALTAHVQALDKTIAQTPKTPENREYISQLTAERDRTKGQIDSFGQKQAAKNTAAIKRIHDSEKGISTRDYIRIESNNIKAKIKTFGKTVTRKEAEEILPTLTALSSAINKAKSSNYMTEGEANSHLNFVEQTVGNYKAIISKPKSLVGQVAEQISDAIQHSPFFPAATPPKAVVKDAAAKDKWHTARDTMLNNLAAKYRKGHGTSPGEAEMKLLDSAATDYANRIAGKPSTKAK